MIIKKKSFMSYNFTVTEKLHKQYKVLSYTIVFSLSLCHYTHTHTDTSIPFSELFESKLENHVAGPLPSMSALSKDRSRIITEQ